MQWGCAMSPLNFSKENIEDIDIDQWICNEISTFILINIHNITFVMVMINHRSGLVYAFPLRQ